jgi:cysteine desulfurase
VPVDFLTLSGHKFHAPKGVGVLFISRRARFRPLLLGGGQEGGRRSGTENVPLIVALGKAASLMQQHLADGTQDRLQGMRDAFELRILSALPDVIVNGCPGARLPTTSSLCFPGLIAAELLILLDQAGICCAAGSACHTASVHPSHVLEAMGLGADHAAATLRFSLSRFNTQEEVQRASETVIRVVEKMRAMRDESSGPVSFA